MLTTQYLHAVLVRVFDAGVLLLGEPGIGKSSIAEILVKRGHSLVADDIVKCYQKNGKVSGFTHNDAYHGKLYVRGKGLFDVSKWHNNAVKPLSTIEFCLSFIKNSKPVNISNIQIQAKNILGVNIPSYDISYGNYHNICTMIEQLVKLQKS